MTRFALPLTLLLTTPALAVDEPTNMDRFQLWNHCRPVSLLVEGLHQEAEAIGLTRERIETTVRSRLRAARLYTPEVFSKDDNRPEVNAVLYVNINAGRLSYLISVEFWKWLNDPATGQSGRATTWDSGGAGTHGQDSGFILSDLAEHIDGFIDEYLRVNEKACSRI